MHQVSLSIHLFARLILFLPSLLLSPLYDALADGNPDADGAANCAQSNCSPLNDCTHSFIHVFCVLLLDQLFCLLNLIVDEPLSLCLALFSHFWVAAKVFLNLLYKFALLS